MTAIRTGPTSLQPDERPFENELTVVGPSGAPAEPQPPVVLVGRLVSLQFVLSALRRRRKVWLSLAVLGLIFGIAYHAVVPRTFSATTTLYLAQSSGSDGPSDMQNDLALLQTNAVADRAAALLGDPSLTPAEFLGKGGPGTALSNNILSIAVSGPSEAEAVRRANALADAYLSFRKQHDQEQTDAMASAINKEIATLQQQVSSLTSRIDALGSSAPANATSILEAEQSTDSSEIASLQQTLQQDQTDNITVAAGSQVLTPATPVHSSTLKLFGLSGLSGLIAGLTIGLAYVAVQAVASDRLRRRDELASLLGAPVELSLKPVRHPKRRPDRWIRQSALTPRGDLGAFAGYLRRCTVSQGDHTTLLVIALDDLVVTAAALAALATRLADEGRSVLVADLTNEGFFARGITDLPMDGSTLTSDAGGSIQILRPSDDEIGDVWDTSRVALGAGAHTTLAFTTIDPGRGAWHLSWAKEAVVSVTAGCSSSQRVSSTAALLRAAGMAIRSGVLLGADAQDESIGLLQANSPLVGLPVEGVIPP